MAGFSSSPALWPYGLGAPVVTLSGLSSPVALWPYGLGAPAAGGPFDLEQSANVGLAGVITVAGDIENDAAGVPFEFEPPLSVSAAGALALSGDIAFGAPDPVGFMQPAWLSAVSAAVLTLNLTQTASVGIAGAVSVSGDVATLGGTLDVSQTANIGLSGVAALSGNLGGTITATTTGSVVYLPIRALTGLWTTSIASESDLTNLRAWLPPQRVALVDSNGVMRPEWYRFFHFVAETKLGGAAAATLPEIATSLTSAVAQSSAASLATASLAQQVVNNADALDVVVQVAQNNTLTGASSIPPVQRSTQQIQ